MDSQRPSTPAWTPEPDRTAEVELPGSLNPLIENLAEKVHNRWAERRLQEGWSFGPERDDHLKTTPNLVPYGELPEVEKNYDRATALTTLKSLYGIGYRVVPAQAATAGADGETAVVEKFLADVDTLRFEAADLLWRSHAPAFWAGHSALLHRLARRASDAGWPLLTFDIVSKTLAADEADGDAIPADTAAKLRHLAVLSLMEVGALERAAQELEKIEPEGGIHGELQGLRGRLAKVRGMRAAPPDEARRWFEEARDTYLAAYRAARDLFAAEGGMEAGTTAYYLGINAASMSAWAGHQAEARAMAGEVLEICSRIADRQAAPGSGGEPDPWLEATRGEAHLLRHEAGAAEAAYRTAAGALQDRWRPLQSMRRQALETARRTGFPEARVESWFRMPELRVLGFAGQPDVTPAAKSVVFFYLREPDQLEFAAAILPRCAEFHLGLASKLAEFRRTLTTGQSLLLDTLLAGATRLHGEEEAQIIGEDIGPHFSKLLFRGSVLLRAQELDLRPVGLPQVDSAALEGKDDGGAPFRALLCADAKGYSRLDARLLRVFVRDYLGCIGSVVDRFRDKTLTVKTAGDGLFMVFRDLESAIRFSLELRDTTAAVDWASRGMPEDLGLRISLDAGPMMEFTDPVTGNLDVAGRMVNRAARIEPITPVNHVYASRTVAALAVALGIPGVRFEYAGETPLPKGFGAFQLYHLTDA